MASPFKRTTTLYLTFQQLLVLVLQDQDQDPGKDLLILAIFLPNMVKTQNHFKTAGIFAQT